MSSRRHIAALVIKRPQVEDFVSINTSVHMKDSSCIELKLCDGEWGGSHHYERSVNGNFLRGIYYDFADSKEALEYLKKYKKGVEGDIRKLNQLNGRLERAIRKLEKYK